MDDNAVAVSVADPADYIEPVETITEYGVRHPDGRVETDWEMTLEEAREDAEAFGGTVVTRKVTSTPWRDA